MEKGSYRKPHRTVLSSFCAHDGFSICPRFPNSVTYTLHHIRAHNWMFIISTHVTTMPCAIHVVCIYCIWCVQLLVRICRYYVSNGYRTISKQIGPALELYEITHTKPHVRHFTLEWRNTSILQNAPCVALDSIHIVCRSYLHTTRKNTTVNACKTQCVWNLMDCF